MEIIRNSLYKFWFCYKDHIAIELTVQTIAKNLKGLEPITKRGKNHENSNRRTSRNLPKAPGMLSDLFHNYLREKPQYL